MEDITASILQSVDHLISTTTSIYWEADDITLLTYTKHLNNCLSTPATMTTITLP